MPVLPKELPKRHHVYNQFIIRFPEGRNVRDRVMTHLKAAGIGCEVYYPLTLPQQECFRTNPGSGEPFPASEAAANQTLAIPIFAELTKEQMREVVSAIVKGIGS